MKYVPESDNPKGYIERFKDRPNARRLYSFEARKRKFVRVGTIQHLLQDASLDVLTVHLPVPRIGLGHERSERDMKRRSSIGFQKRLDDAALSRPIGARQGNVGNLWVVHRKKNRFGIYSSLVGLISWREIHKLGLHDGRAVFAF